MNNTPTSDESLRLSGALRPSCGDAARLAEQSALASLTSELAASASFDYLHRRTLRVLRRRVLKSLLLRQKENTGYPIKGILYFGAEGEI